FDGTALNESDYEGIKHRFTFSVGSTEACVSLIIVNDNIKEEIESFQFALSARDDPVLIIRYFADVFIHDDDRVTVILSLG
ncbi:hypothetical protein GBAR_LOCUS26599, partial [Geodia barretti]